MELRHTARGIVVRDGQLLMFERRRLSSHGRRMHYYSVPGGGIDYGEHPAEAVVRELREEMGITVRAERLLVKQTTPVSIHYYFLCTIVSGEPVFQADSEEAGDTSGDNTYAIAWVPLDQRHHIHFFPDYRQAVDVIERRGLLGEALPPVDIVFKRRYTKKSKSNE